ncbi:MAG: DUF126 domain-containing protein [Desulfurococcales archaeon]|nr:DUF126 domain-containing protein [Desulfurococcales archaeon]
MAFKTYRGRVLVEGTAEGEAVVVDTLSFYGDVDPETGVLVDGRSISGRILLVRRGRGSTVGSYIIYSLKANGKAPLAILMEKSEPIIVAGAVLAGIPLVDSLPKEVFEEVKDGYRVRVSNGLVEVIG